MFVYEGWRLNNNEEIINRDDIVYIWRLKVGYRFERTIAAPLPIVNLRLSKALTDTFYDPRASSLPVNTPLPGTRANQAFISPSGWSSISNGRVNCKNVECFRSPLLPFSSSRFTWFGWRQVWGGGINGRPWRRRVSAARSHDDSSRNSAIQESSIDSSLSLSLRRRRIVGSRNDEENIFQKSNPWDHLLQRRMD